MYSFLIFTFIFNAAIAQKILETGVSSGDIKLIVEEHNQFRNKLTNGQVPKQPRAINLKQMSWDFKLAKEAQNIANRCKFEHVKVQDGRFSVGQNLAYSWSSDRRTPDWKGSILMWFNEYKLYHYDRIVANKEFHKIGHYTQMMWANTNLVGCGYALCQRGSTYERSYVCNYGPAGNIIGQYPYETK